MRGVSTEVISTHREGFEEGTFRHLEALWRVVQCVTTSQRSAWKLILKTVTQVCCTSRASFLSVLGKLRRLIQGAELHAMTP